jgi:hypothetical protein
MKTFIEKDFNLLRIKAIFLSLNFLINKSCSSRGTLSDIYIYNKQNCLLLVVKQYCITVFFLLKQQEKWFLILIVLYIFINSLVEC